VLKIGAIPPPAPALDPACGWLRSTDAASIASIPRLNMFFAGDWTTGALCIKPFATDADCTVTSGSSNLIDETKWITEIPSEDGWLWDQSCRAFLPVKVGPVRAVRRIIGAKSGRYTTKIEYFYGTWFEQVVNLRVHSIGSVQLLADNRAINAPPAPADTPSLFFAKSYSLANNNYPMDSMDLSAPASNVTQFGDWSQVDFSRGTYVEFIEEKRGIRDAAKTFVYEDSTNSTMHEFQAGHLGQHGMKWAGSDGQCLPDTQDFLCYPDDPENNSNLQYV